MVMRMRWDRPATVERSGLTGDPDIPDPPPQRGPRPGSRRLDRDRQQVTGPGAAAGVGVLPASLAGPVAAVKQVVDRGSPTLDQLALAALIESGRYDRHLRRMRAEYSTRRETLIASLAEHASQLRLTGLAAGFHAVAHLPAGAQEERIVALARANGVGLHGMSRYRSTRAATPAQLVIGFGNANARAIGDGVAAIASLLR